MNTDIVPITIKGIMPTSSGCAVFLGPEEKTFIIYVDAFIGNSISMALKQIKKERPLTHDLIESIFKGFEISIEHVVINDRQEDTFFARIILKMNNELGTKILEVDARPSDSMVLAVQKGCPIFVARAVLDNVEDVTELLERIQDEDNSEEM
jgi:bifunctional DNase/RNase